MTEHTPGPWAQGHPPQPGPPYHHPAGYPPTSYPPAGYPAPYPPQVVPVPAAPYSPLVGRQLVSQETTWSLLSHLSILALGIIGPIIIMNTEGKKSPYTRYHAVEALNMHLTLLIAQMVCLALFWLIIPILLLLAAGIAAYIFGVLAATAANRGELYRYPLTIRMVK